MTRKQVRLKKDQPGSPNFFIRQTIVYQDSPLHFSKPIGKMPIGKSEGGAF